MTRWVTCWSMLVAALLANTPSSAGQLAHVRLRNITPEDVLRVVRIGFDRRGFSVSPSGKWYAFEQHQADLRGSDYEGGWYVGGAATRGGVRKIADLGELPLFRSGWRDGFGGENWSSYDPQWSPDEKWISYLRMEDGRVSVWKSAIDGSRSERVTDLRQDVLSFVWSHKSDGIIYGLAANRSDDTLSRDKLHGRLVDSNSEWSAFDARGRSLANEAPEVLYIDPNTKAVRQPTDDERLEYFSAETPAAFPTIASDQIVARFPSATGRRVAYLSYDDSNRRLLQPPLALSVDGEVMGGRDSIVCAARECHGQLRLDKWAEPGPVYWAPDERSVFFFNKGFYDGYTSLYEWSPSTRRIRTVLRTRDVISSCAFRSTKVICLRQSVRYPERVVSIDLKTGYQAVLYDPNPGWAALRVAQVEWLELNSTPHGSFALLVKPIGYHEGKRYPAVVVGYSSDDAVRGATGDEYPIQALAEAGFVVIVYNYAQSTDDVQLATSGLDYLKRVHKDGIVLTEPLSLIKEAIDELDQKGVVDRSRVAITGYSNGAQVAQYGLATTSLFATAILSWANWNPASYNLVVSDRRRDGLNAAGLGGDGHDDAFGRVSLSRNVGAIKAPILIQASDDEYLFQLQDFVTFRDHKKPLEMFVYPDEGHYKYHPVNRLEIYQRNIQWLKFWLYGVEVENPVDAGQYSRWRAMRSEGRAGDPSQH